MKPYKVVVMCHANRFRSPLAHGFLQQACAAEGLYKPEVLVDIHSAGFRPDDGRKAGKPVREAALQQGFSLDNHRSQLATNVLLKDADLVLYMDGGNFDRLCKVTNIRNCNHHCLGKWCHPERTRIEDLAFISPYTKPDKFAEVVAYIRDACYTVVKDVIAPAARKRQAGIEPPTGTFRDAFRETEQQ